MGSTQPARGTRDFLPADLRRREHVIAIVRRVYERYGFEPLETPAFENLETLLGKYGEEGAKLIFKILKRGEHEASGQADLALRYDLTVPLARVIAEHQAQLPKFFRRYQIQPVWRADRPARGRFREFYQCDVDAIGSTSISVEVEVIAAVSEVLAALGFTDFTIRLNDRRLLAALLAQAGVPPALETEALIALDKLDKIGPAGVAADLAARGIDPRAASACLALFDQPPDDGPAVTIARLERQLGEMRTAVRDVAAIAALAEVTPAAGRIRVDPSLARGLSYYTGAIMEIAVPDLAGSLGGGGRYDRLIGMFLGRDVPACGFSLGLERIIVVMAERGMFPASVGRGPADVMVALWSDASRADAHRLAARFREGGLRVDVYPDADKPGKQFKYASLRQYPFVAIAGDDEQAQDSVTLKDMQSGSQATVPRADAVEHLVGQLTRDTE
ncbi:MAG: histidine--tRNA ligase [Acidobacteria bacterium]|nr:histidine--tRNA ligase [Acidobacteriota bacterium]